MADDWEDSPSFGRNYTDVKKCKNCGGVGHLAKTCSSPANILTRPAKHNHPGSYQQNQPKCYRCNQNGHIARDCDDVFSQSGGYPNQGRGGDNFGKDSRKYHKANGDQDIWGQGFVPPNRESWNNKFRGDNGYASHKKSEQAWSSRSNHWESKPRRGGGFNHRQNSNHSNDGSFACFNCGDRGHRARDCSMESSSQKNGVKKDKPEEYIPPDVNVDSLYDEGYSTGINFENYENIPCEVTGREPPKPAENFETIGLHENLMKNVHKANYVNLTPVQKHAIPIIMNDRDLMACAQTGSGKTVAFLLPIIQKLVESEIEPHACEPQIPEVLILTPTRELAVQIRKEAMKFTNRLKLGTFCLYGGTSVTSQFSLFTQNNINIVVATPGRFLQALREKIVSLKNIKYFVLDEADRMLDMGFGPDIDDIVKDPSMTPKFRRQTLLFSATFPDKIQEAAATYLKDDYLFLKVGVVGSACKDVRQTVFECEKFQKREKLVDILNGSQEGTTGITEKTLVFVETKQNADFLALYLSSDFKATSIHGDRFQSQREEALKNFVKGQMTVLVATAVAARGLDIPKVAHVINYDLPNTIDEYVHRIGRTGRVGNIGKATSFYDTETDLNLAKPLVQILEGADQEVPDFLLKEADKAPGVTKDFGGTFGNFASSDIRKNEMGTVRHAELEDDEDDWD